jgi:hypothetical protein
MPKNALTDTECEGLSPARHDLCGCLVLSCHSVPVRAIPALHPLP